MTLSNPLYERAQTAGEEIANSITHFIGFLSAAVATPYLILHTVNTGEISAVIGSSFFAATILIVYASSTLYHSIPAGRIKNILRIVDHCAIFLLIAGTYTPFALGVIGGTWGITLLVLQWMLAFAGIGLKLFTGLKYRKLSIFLYLAMGWMVIIAIEPFLEGTKFMGIFWVFAGGVAYTLGIPFYAAKNTRYTHLIWHMFVLTGSGCHFIAVMWYSA